MHPAVTAEQQTGIQGRLGANGRGINVYSYAELMTYLGQTKDGAMIQAPVQMPYFVLSIFERVDIFRLCSPVFGVVTSRMNRIAGMDFEVIPEKKVEDRVAEGLKMFKAIYREYEGREEFKYQIARGQIRKEVMKSLPDVLPDLSNFDASLLRWRRRIQSVKKDKADDIKKWLEQPNIQDSFIDFRKQWVFDLMIHGSAAIYKEAIGGRCENLYVVMGGTVIPLRHPQLGGSGGYLQLVATGNPQVFYGDEMSYARYIPISSRSYPAVPLEALTNKVAETLLFDQLMAMQADGTKPPDKVVVFGDTTPYGNDLPEGVVNVPIDSTEQDRIEVKLNEMKKRAIATLSGVGHPIVLDMTRENTMSTQMERQRMIREEVALVFNMSNMEINMTGSEDTSGRATSESQEKIELGKGIAPIAALLEEKLNHDVLPYREGPGFFVEFKPGQNEKEALEYHRDKLQSGLYALNEIRINDMNEDPFPGEEYDKPQGSQPPKAPDGSDKNPFSVVQSMTRR